MQSKERQAIPTVTDYFDYRALPISRFYSVVLLTVLPPATWEIQLLFFNA